MGRHYLRDVSKHLAQTLHAQRRFAERTNLPLTRELRRKLVSMIHEQKNVRFVERQSNRITVWEAEVEGQFIHIVYDKERKNIVTVLPLGLPDDDGESPE